MPYVCNLQKYICCIHKLGMYTSVYGLNLNVTVKENVLSPNAFVKLLYRNITMTQRAARDTWLGALKRSKGIPQRNEAVPHAARAMEDQPLSEMLENSKSLYPLYPKSSSPETAAL